MSPSSERLEQRLVCVVYLERSEDWELFETVGSLLEDATESSTRDSSDATSSKSSSSLLYTPGERGPAKTEDVKVCVSFAMFCAAIVSILQKAVTFPSKHFPLVTQPWTLSLYLSVSCSL